MLAKLYFGDCGDNSAIVKILKIVIESDEIYASEVGIYSDYNHGSYGLESFHCHILFKGEPLILTTTDYVRDLRPHISGQVHEHLEIIDWGIIRHIRDSYPREFFNLEDHMKIRLI